jgi:hypothetical protein
LQKTHVVSQAAKGIDIVGYSPAMTLFQDALRRLPHARTDASSSGGHASLSSVTHDSKAKVAKLNVTPVVDQHVELAKDVRNVQCG